MPDTDTVEPLLPFRRLLDEAAKLARRNLRSVYLPIALPLAVLHTLTVVIQLRTMRRWYDAVESQDAMSMFSAMLMMLGPSLLLSLVFGLTYACLYAACVDVVAGRTPDLKARALFVLRPRVLVTLIAAALCIFAGAVACLLPGVIVGLLLSFLVPVMVEEREELFGAFSRSAAIARYNPRGLLSEIPMIKVLVLGIVSLLLSWVIAWFLQMPLAVAQQILTLREVADSGSIETIYEPRWLWFHVPSAILGSFANTLIQFYVGFGIALLYFDVRRRREGSDLEAAIDRIAGS